MIYLDRPLRKLQIVLAGAITTNQWDITAHFFDQIPATTTTLQRGGVQKSNSNSTTDVTIVDAVGLQGIIRNIRLITLHNKDTVTSTVTVKLDDSGAQTILVKQAIAAGESLVYEDGRGFEILSPITPPFVDTTDLVKGSLDSSKHLRIEVDGITTGTTRVWTVADADIVVSGSAAAMTTGRMVYTTTGGLLLSDANALYNGTNLTLTPSGTFTLAPVTLGNIDNTRIGFSTRAALQATTGDFSGTGTFNAALSVSVGPDGCVRAQTGGSLFLDTVDAAKPIIIRPGIAESGRFTSTGLQGAVGATTPNTGAFTTLSATGNVTLGDGITDATRANGTVLIAGNTDATIPSGYFFSGNNSLNRQFRFTQPAQTTYLFQTADGAGTYVNDTTVTWNAISHTFQVNSSNVAAISSTGLAITGTLTVSGLTRSDAGVAVGGALSSSEKFHAEAAGAMDVLVMKDSSQSANNKIWRLSTNASQFLVQTVDDAYSAASTAMSFSRSGNTVSGVSIGAALTYGGVTFANTTTGSGSLVGSAGATHTGTTTFTGPIDASGAAAGQISFPAAQNASAGANVLDDYEEGTWTPSVGGTATYTTQSGTYTKIGRLVFFTCVLQINAIGTGSTTTISGLPFTSAQNTGVSVGNFGSAAANFVSVYAQVQSATIVVYSETVAAAADVGNAFFGTATQINISGSYSV